MGFTNISNLISYNNRFNISRKNNSTFFNGDLLTLIQKYPMLWGWLLDYNPTDTVVNKAITHALNNTYGIKNNPIKPDVSVVTDIEKNENSNNTLNDELVLAYLRKNEVLKPNETLDSISWARNTITQAYNYRGDSEKYKSDAQNYIHKLENEINRLNNELNNAQTDSNLLNSELKLLQEKFKNIPPPTEFSNNFWRNPDEYYKSAKAEIFTGMWLNTHGKEMWENHLNNSFN